MSGTRQLKEHSLLYTQAMAAIEEYIVSKNLSPGSKLPSERELALLFNCSRTAVREALKSLESIGIVEILVGRGAFISEFGWSDLIQHVSPFISRKEDGLAYLTEARMTIEPAIISLVIDKVNDDDLAKLEEIVRKFESAETFEELTVLDLQFHQTLMGITRNPLLTEFSRLLKEYFVTNMQNFTKQKNNLTIEKYEAALKNRSVSEHRKLYEAIRRRDKEQARDLLLKHILWRENELVETARRNT